MDIATKIAAFEEKLTKHKNEKARLQGKLEVADQNLKDLGFDSVEEAEAHIKAETERLDGMESELISDIREFEEEYAEYLQE